MEMTELQDRIAIHELTDVFANLADVRDVEGQGELFLPDGVLEFQMGPEGEVHEIVGREAIVSAFRNTVLGPELVYHINGQQNLTAYTGDTAEGTAYCEATLSGEQDGEKVVTTNYVRYTDHYAKVDGRWYLARRRTVFIYSETRPAQN